MKRTIALSEVKAFIAECPPHILKDLHSMIGIMIGKVGGEDSDEDLMASFPSARDQMTYEEDVVQTKSASSANLASSLRSQLPPESKLDNYTLDEYSNVKLELAETDKYDDGIFIVHDHALLTVLSEMKKKCAVDNIYLPFGFGPGKDRLKIKKFGEKEVGKMFFPGVKQADLDLKGKQFSLNLRFVKWGPTSGKIGFSCYVKTK